ncbi:MAG: thiolase family protein [Myxococcales bacterium]|nr:thiolase family protein [Myxococcales bacterium]
MQLKDVVIVSAVRSAIGSFGGMFKDATAHEMGVTVAKEAIQRAQIDPALIEDVILGHCMMRTDEINIARIVGLKAGLPITTTGMTIQRQCASGMQAMFSGMQQIMTGDAEAVLVGGVENMSNIPFVMKDARWGGRMGHLQATDALLEGLTDPIGHFHMGITAENLAAKYNISREEQDQLAATSHERALAAIDAGRFKEEIVPYVLKTRKGEQIIDTDEHPRRGTTAESLARLKPAFKKDGTVTAGNASGINDGAAMMVLMSEERARALGAPILAKITAYSKAGVEPELMGYGPVPAVKKLLERSGKSLSDIQLIEVNEAFAAQYLACEKGLELDRSITNVNGSGISLGHPVGATGCRISTTLLYEMKRRDLRTGMATLCVGGGMGAAILIER